jgi:hypothetical protein
MENTLTQDLKKTAEHNVYARHEEDLSKKQHFEEPSVMDKIMRVTNYIEHKERAKRRIVLNNHHETIDADFILVK